MTTPHRRNEITPSPDEIREALEKISEFKDYSEGSIETWMSKMSDIARKALEER
jgi:hypothetical protein